MRRSERGIYSECGKRESAKEEVARSVRACAVTGARRGESERATERVA